MRKFLALLLTVLFTLSLQASVGPPFGAGSFGVGTTTGGGGGGATPVFNFANFTGAAGSFQCQASTQISSGVMALARVAVGGHQAGACWYTTKINPTSFTTDFTATMASAAGWVFVIQNLSTTTFANDANGIGFAVYRGSPAFQTPNPNSFAIKFDHSGQNNQAFYPGGVSPSTIGLAYNNGPDLELGGIVPESDLTPTSVSLTSANPIHFYITYNDPVLTVVGVDTVSGASFRKIWSVDIPTLIGSTSAWFGFAFGQPGTPGTDGTINQWALSTGVNTQLATPVPSISPGKYTSTQSVTLSNCGSPVACYYTTNGLPPTTAGTLYTGASITVASTLALQVVATEATFQDSAVSSSLYTIGAGSPPSISITTGNFGSSNGLVQVAGISSIQSGNVQIVNTAGAGANETGGAWIAVPMPANAFTAIATVTNTVGANCCSDGIAFAWQNSTAPGAGEFATGGGATNLGYPGPNYGYAPAYESVAVTVHIDSNPGTVALCVHGAVPSSCTQTTLTGGVNVQAGHPLQFTFTYSGTSLSLNILDTSNSDTMTTGWTIDIPGTVGASSAYFGVTGGNGGDRSVITLSQLSYN